MDRAATRDVRSGAFGRRTLVVVGLCFFAPQIATAQATATLHGRVVDAATGIPIAGATVLLPGVARSALSGAEGRFTLQEVGTEPVLVRIRRLGYATLQQRVAAVAGDTVRFALVATPLELAAVNVSAGRLRGVGEGFQAATVIDGAALDRRMGSSIATIIAGVPGVTQRYNGPAAAQPVIRGLTGDRVLVLEDGLRTGDIATTAPDHAVTIEPLSARRVEVIRGPAGLAYGPNTLGGVVNVVREDVPRTRPERVVTSAATQFESVNRGGTVMGVVEAPVGPLALRVEGNARTAGDTRTPGGELPFTDLDAFEGGAGLSLATRRGFLGVAVRDFKTYYGVPSSFGGTTLPGAHAGGVYVDVRRSTARLEGELLRDGVLSSVRAVGNYVRFAQDEHELGGIIGTRFGQLAASGDLIARLAHGRHSAAVGASGQWRDFRAVGSFTGTRPASLVNAGLHAFDEISLSSRWRVMVGARFDDIRIAPLDSTETRLLRNVRTRQFQAWSGSMATTFALTKTADMGINIARAFRAPAIEELFSAGPHLASYAYEVGNPELRPEVGLGSDAFLRITGERTRGEITVFVNNIDDFVQYRPVLDSTGLPQRDPRLRRYVVYQSSQVNARLLGIEGSMERRLTSDLVVDGTVSFVQGSNREGGEPLPAMPPLRVRAGVRRDTPRWFAGAAGDWNARAGRVPSVPLLTATTCNVRRSSEGEAELLPAELCPTPGAFLVTANAGVRWTLGRSVHALSLVAENLLNSTWRDHLWRAKQVAPQPGRNFKLLYRVGQ